MTPGGFVNQLFKNIFGRTPSDEELQAWLDKLSEGMSAAEMVRDFILGEENQAKLAGSSNEEFLDFLYNVVFLREAETEGLSAWLARMDAGMTMEEVLDGFLSEEFGNLSSLFGI